MKNILLITLLFYTVIGNCQTPVDTAEFKYETKFSDRNKLCLLNANGIFIITGNKILSDFGLNGITEYKLWKYHSLFAGIGLVQVYKQPIFAHYHEKTRNINLNISGGYRYYYNLKDRMIKGLTGNNFNANYLQISPYLLLGYEPYELKSYDWDFNRGMWELKYKSSIKAQAGLNLGYGIQRSYWNKLN